MTFMKIKILVLICLVAFAAPVAGQKKKSRSQEKRPEQVQMRDQEALAPPVKVTTVEGITEYRLQNGSAAELPRRPLTLPQHDPIFPKC